MYWVAPISRPEIDWMHNRTWTRLFTQKHDEATSILLRWQHRRPEREKHTFTVAGTLLNESAPHYILSEWFSYAHILLPALFSRLCAVSAELVFKRRSPEYWLAERKRTKFNAMQSIQMLREIYKHQFSSAASYNRIKHTSGIIFDIYRLNFFPFGFTHIAVCAYLSFMHTCPYGLPNGMVRSGAYGPGYGEYVRSISIPATVAPPSSAKAGKRLFISAKRRWSCLATMFYLFIYKVYNTLNLETICENTHWKLPEKIHTRALCHFTGDIFLCSW